MTNLLTTAVQPTSGRDTRDTHQSDGAVSRSIKTLAATKGATPSPFDLAYGTPAGSTGAANDVSPLPPALEFTRLINNQFLVAARLLKGVSTRRTDPKFLEEAIASRADLFREVSKATPGTSEASGLPRTSGRPVLTPTTTRLWARLDADDFRALNTLDRDMYAHVAQWMDENAYPAYQEALRQYAPDIYNIVGATRRVRDVSYSPVRHLPAKRRDRGQIALPFDAVEVQRSGHGSAHCCVR